MNESNLPMSALEAADAQAALAKLPILGPIAWLYARTPDKRFLFLSDLDWALLPPVVLDQYRLIMKEHMPFALVTWAFVSDEVHQRMLLGNMKLAPHEWKQGPHLWLVDVVTPFGGRDTVLADCAQQFKGSSYNFLEIDPVTRKAGVKKVIGPAAPAEGATSSALTRH